MRKIVNPDGKIFGFINIFDFLCLLFLILLIPMVYHGYKLTQVKQEFVKGGYHPAVDVPATKVLLETQMPVILNIRFLTEEEAAFIEKNMSLISAGPDIWFRKAYKKLKHPISLVAGDPALMNIYHLYFPVLAQVKVLRRENTGPEILFRTIPVAGQTLKVSVADKKFTATFVSMGDYAEASGVVVR